MKKRLSKKQLLQILKKEQPFLQEKYGVVKIAIYGSYAQNKQTQKSDVDILVQLTSPLGLEFVELANHLEKALGRKVDLATFEDLQRTMGNMRRRHIALNIQNSLSYV
ncbi:MAG TPA: nucleotidyltransferase family protein [bacterium]